MLHIQEDLRQTLDLKLSSSRPCMSKRWLLICNFSYENSFNVNEYLFRQTRTIFTEAKSQAAKSSQKIEIQPVVGQKYNDERGWSKKEALFASFSLFSRKKLLFNDSVTIRISVCLCFKARRARMPYMPWTEVLLRPLRAEGMVLP